MFHAIPKTTGPALLRQLLIGAALLLQISSAFGESPRRGRTTRIAATPPTRSNYRSESRVRHPVLNHGSPHNIRTPFTNRAAHPPAGNSPSLQSGGDVGIVTPHLEWNPACPKTRFQVHLTANQSAGWEWGSVATFQTPANRLFRWKTGEASALGIRWYLYDCQTPSERTAPIGTGLAKYPYVPPGEEWATFYVDLSELLPIEAFRHKNYWMHVVPINEQNQSVGAASPSVRLFHRHPPTDLAVTSCHVKDGDYWNYDLVTVECRIENVGKCVLEAHRTYYIKQYYPNRVLQTGVIPAGLKPGEVYRTSVTADRPGSDTFFACGLNHTDGNEGNDGATTK